MLGVDRNGGVVVLPESTVPMPYWNSGVGGMCGRGRCFSCRFDCGFAGGVVGVVHIAVV